MNFDLVNWKIFISTKMAVICIEGGKCTTLEKKVWKRLNFFFFLPASDNEKMALNVRQHFAVVKGLKCGCQSIFLDLRTLREKKIMEV